jgi:DNA-binding transcriptional LysR family regulator
MRHEVAGRETIQLADVRAFCAVVDAGSVTAAARVLGETKGSVSRRVTRLESALGATLLRRSPRSLAPTDEGRLYRARAGAALEALEGAAIALDEAREVPRGLLRVTAPSDLGVGLLPELCASFVARYPEVKLEVLASDERLDLDAHHIDCALRVGVLRDSTLRVTKLLDLGFGLYASPAYLTRHGDPRRPDELTAHRVAAYVQMPRPLELSFSRAGRATHVSLEPTIFGDGAFVRELVLHGGAIAGMPQILGDREVATGRLVRVLPDHLIPLTAPLSLLHPAASYVPAKITAFREHVLAALARRRGARLGDAPDRGKRPVSARRASGSPAPPSRRPVPRS